MMFEQTKDKKQGSLVKPKGGCGVEEIWEAKPDGGDQLGVCQPKFGVVKLSPLSWLEGKPNARVVIPGSRIQPRNHFQVWFRRQG